MVNKHRRRGHWLLAGLACAALGGIATLQASPTGTQNMQHENMHHARGSFDVKVTPQENKTGEPALSHLLLEKQFHGDLTATSRGQMLAAETPIEGSGGYVAIEKVTGTLHGRRGSFVVQHVGHMGRGQMSLTLTILPDSGTEQLEGLAGSMRIIIEQGKHLYELDYTLGIQ